MKNNVFKQDLYENPCKTMKIYEIRSPRAAQAYMENSEGANRRVKGIYILYADQPGASMGRCSHLW